jgi:hypothetical protein
MWTSWSVWSFAAPSFEHRLVHDRVASVDALRLVPDHLHGRGLGYTRALEVTDRKARNGIAAKMTPAQIAEAQRLGKWKPAPQLSPSGDPL